MTESDSEAKATKGAVAASGSEEARDIESAIGEDERESNRGAALAIVVAHMALMLLSGAALGVLSSGGFSNGTSGLILAFGSMLYPVLLPATVVAVVPPALMLPFAFGAAPAFALGAAATYLPCSLALLGMAVPFQSAPAILLAVALLALGLLSAKVGTGR